MRTDYFAELAELLKNTGNRGNQGNHNINSLINNDLSGYPTVTQTANDWVTRVTGNAEANDADNAVTQVTHELPEWVTEGNQKNHLRNQHLSSRLPKLPKLPEKTDNSATQRLPNAAETQPAESNTNRTQPPPPGETLPFGQRELDAIRQGFGVWVWSGVLKEWSFWVRDDERKAKALTKGIDRWRIWTLDELTAAQGMQPADLRNVFAIKRRFDGAVQPGAKPHRWRDALEPLQPAVATLEVREPTEEPRS